MPPDTGPPKEVGPDATNAEANQQQVSDDTITGTDATGAPCRCGISEPCGCPANPFYADWRTGSSSSKAKPYKNLWLMQDAHARGVRFCATALWAHLDEIGRSKAIAIVNRASDEAA